MSWFSPSEEDIVLVVTKLKNEIKKYAKKWSEEEHANAHTRRTAGSHHH
jgi:hypothetical protein